MCGIAGIISTEKTKFNINHFNILGVLNDERGGDSCGIFIDKRFQYGIKDTKQFRVFTTCIKDYPETAQIALLHCRKASAGYTVNVAQAQPILIFNENKEVDFVLMHNGTITNAVELAKKYLPDLDTKDLSDSQVMAQIFYHKGYDALLEYRGAAVFVIVDYRKNENGDIFFWKGNSDYNEYNANYERPLYYMIHDRKFYFSSMYCFLYCIDNVSKIENLPSNQLFALKNNELVQMKYYDRTTVKKPVVKYDYDNYYQSSITYGSIHYITYNQYTGLYMIGKDPAHGVYSAYVSGCITQNTGKYVHTFYFMYGRLLYNKECYDLLEDILTLFDETIINKNTIQIIDYFAYNPIKIETKFVEVNENFKYENIQNREWYSLFNNCLHYILKDGKLDIHNSYATKAVEDFEQDASSIFFDFEALYQDISEYLIKTL